MFTAHHTEPSHEACHPLATARLARWFRGPQRRAWFGGPTRGNADGREDRGRHAADPFPIPERAIRDSAAARRCTAPHDSLHILSRSLMRQSLIRQCFSVVAVALMV